ncbi:MAG: hypothetical protein VYD05_15825 [Planctomycetota bacterium]|nr:hypothetical protein [Planctomycetota bacterium]MEC8253313.1 hypothetical protein [Planctomycetota bacterium]MEC8651303.1 hypothetical protein [Planctomycetota bacterium]MEC9048178.1 hypothetical protein [Planctomycetota bacterium]
MQCTIAGVWFAASMLSVVVAQGPVSEVVKMTVARKASIKGLKTFSQPGVELEVGVRVPGKPLLSVDLDKCKLRRFVDDKGTDLSAGAPKGFFGWVSMSSSFREDPTDSCILQIKTKTLPGAGAGAIELEAEVALTSASGSESKEERIALKKGAKISCGPIPIEIRGMEEVDFGDSKFSVQLASDQSMDAIKALEFLGADGKPMKAEPMGSGSFGFGGKKTYTRSYGLPERPSEVTVRITAYANKETIVVPLKLSIGMGLR